MIHAMNRNNILINKQIACDCQKLASVITWSGITSKWNFPHLVEDEIKFNRHVYLNMLKGQLFFWINLTITLQINGLTTRTFSLIEEYCKNNMLGFRIRKL